MRQILRSLRKARSAAVPLTLLLLMVSVGTPVGAQEAGQQHRIGAALGTMLDVSGSDNPYGPPVSVGLFYEARGLLPHGFYPQIRFAYSHFTAQDADYGSSGMLTFGAGAGWEIVEPEPVGRPFGFSAVLGYQHYLRWLEKDGESHTTHRPMPYAGFDGRLEFGASSVGLLPTVEVAFDNTPHTLISVALYYAYNFGGSE